MLNVATPIGAKRSNGLFYGRDFVSRETLIAPIIYDFPIPAFPCNIKQSGSTNYLSIICRHRSKQLIEVLSI